MVYIVNPADPTRPIDTDPAEQGQAELRALKAYIQSLLPGGFGNQNFFRKNLLINGSMLLDQRLEGAVLTTPAGAGQSATYVSDHWAVWTDVNSLATAKRSTGGLGNGSQFKIDLITTSPGALLITDTVGFETTIEGLNAAFLQWGTANALPFSLSFLIQSPVAGLHAVGIRNSAKDTSYVATFNVPNAGVPALITLNDIPGPTAGTWLTDTGIGVDIFFDMGSGSNFETATPNVWMPAAGNFTRTAACVHCQGIIGTVSITQVQFEQGLLCSIFEQRSVTEQLALARRYYEKTFAIGTQPVQNGGLSNSLRSLQVGSVIMSPWRFKVSKRVVPTIITYCPSAASIQCWDETDAGGTICASTAVTETKTEGIYITATPASGGVSGDRIAIHATASAELL